MSWVEKEIEVLLYNLPNSDMQVEAIVKDETLRLTQKSMARLFEIDQSWIARHMKNIFDTWELEKNSVYAIFAYTGSDGKTYDVQFYNLDAIISVWYRVNSAKATKFRIRATKVLREYIIKWFALDDERLKNWNNLWRDYFEELLERVHSIRSSERRIRQQITDLFAECSVDYERDSEITKEFYATIQNKFHYAITWKTAAEIVYEKADKDKPFMWMTTRKNAPKWRILKSDTIIAKNYLSEKEIKKLERTVSNYFDYIENQIEKKHIFTMSELAESVNRFLDFNSFDILEWKWNITHEQAEQKAFWEYNDFNRTQSIESDFDKLVKWLAKDF